LLRLIGRKPNLFGSEKNPWRSGNQEQGRGHAGAGSAIGFKLKPKAAE
jgi:hypothetical protein